MRRISKEHELDLSLFSDDELNDAFLKAEEWLQEYQVKENVEPSWGELPEHWVPAVGIAFETLGFKELPDDLLMSIESKWKRVTTSTDFEFFIEESIQALDELYRRGYQLGICARRHDNPIGVIERSGLQDIFSVVEWTGIPGYAKPSPYTLLRNWESTQDCVHSSAIMWELTSKQLFGLRCCPSFSHGLLRTKPRKHLKGNSS